MREPTAASSPIPSAPFDDLNLDVDADRREWSRRLDELAAARLAAARARLERLGIVDKDGKLTSTELPADMLPDSDTTLETG
jgi:hypothetical protein